MKSFLWILVGVLGALCLDRFIETRKQRYTPHAMTGRFLDMVNSRLERDRAPGA